jgi:hypothetical protein
MSAPFSRVVRVETIPKEGQTVALEANAAEREALASLYGLPSIASLRASLALNRTPQGGARVTGAVHGVVTQICVISLESFQANVAEEIDVRFAPQGQAHEEPGANEPQTFTMADEDEPDPIIEGKIDIGALAAEFLALGLDPYPRKPGATFEFQTDDHGEKVSPFSSLAELGRKRD